MNYDHGSREEGLAPLRYLETPITIYENKGDIAPEAYYLGTRASRSPDTD